MFSKTEAEEPAEARARAASQAEADVRDAGDALSAFAEAEAKADGADGPSAGTSSGSRRRPRLGTAVRGMPTGLAARAGELSLAASLLSLVLVLCPMPWLWLGLGLGLFSLTFGWTTYRRRDWTGAVRLFGAAATSVALLAVMLAGLRIALSFAAVLRLEQMLR